MSPREPVYTGLKMRKLADRTTENREVKLRIPAGTAVSDETGALLVDPGQVQKILVNPATPGFDHEPWPSAGIELIDPPKHLRIGTGKVSQGRAEGWLTVEGESVVHRPGGPREEPWRVTHTFAQVDALVFHTVHGDVRYRVVGNPDKWPAEKIDGDLGFGGEVRWYYDAELED